MSQQWPPQSAYLGALDSPSPPAPDTLRARLSPPLGGTLCVAPEVSGSGPPVEPAAGQAVPADALTSPGERPPQTGQLDTEGAKISGAATHPTSCRARDQPFPSGRAGGDSEQGRRQQEGEPDTDLRH